MGSGWDQKGDNEDLASQLEKRFGEPPSGWYGMHCWEGLSDEQQQLLIEKGVLPFGRWQAEQTDRCAAGAEVAIEAMWETAPGPRFYCLTHAIEYLEQHQ